MSKKSSKDIIIGLDVGTSKVATIVGNPNEEMGFDVIGIGTAPNTAMRKGTVIDLEDTISAISASLEEAEKMSGYRIENAILAAGGDHIKSADSKGVIAVSGDNGEVGIDDIERVIEAAKSITQPTNREMLHIMPRLYTVDGQSGVKDPLGLTGIRLEVEAHVISASTPALKNLTKCVEQAGVNIMGLVYSGIASANSMLSKKQKEIGVVLADIGAGTTDLVVCEEGEVIHSATLPVGSMNITNDIAIGLKTSIATAEAVKLKYGVCKPDAVSDHERINLTDFDKNEEQEASQKYLAEIIEARMAEILSLIKEELKSVNKDGMLPAGAVFCGGGAKLGGLVDLSKEILRLPSSVGTPIIELTGFVDKVIDPSYATVIGLIQQALKEPIKRDGFFSMPKVTSASATPNKIRDWFKQFIP